MFHPLIRLLAARPHLLTAHLAAYGGLLGVQAQAAVAVLQRRAVLLAGLALGAALGLGLAGAALLLVAALPLQTMPAPWLLVLVPAVPLLLALACALALRRAPTAWSAEPLRAQWAADAELLQALGEA